MLKNNYIVEIVVIFACIIMLFIDGVIIPSYWVKSFIKLILFFVVPCIYFIKNKEISLKTILATNKKNIFKSILLGISLYIIILCAFFIVSNFFDFKSTMNIIKETNDINREDFIGMGIYIIFINSFIEEFFFRGFSFLTLKKYTTRKFAYLFSSLAFSIYHVAMMYNWFVFWIFGAILFFLVIGGLIFNYLSEKYDNIYMSWIVHMFANLAINTIGLMLF